MSSWITLYPRLYHNEFNNILRSYPDLRYSSKDLKNGILAFIGEIKYRSSKKRIPQPFLIEYPNAFPYSPPQFFPLVELLCENDWMALELRKPINIFWMKSGYLRHQMPNGNLCLIEADSHYREDIIRGSDILKRAHRVFFAISRNASFPFPDTEESELESHYVQTGDILLPEVFYSDEVKGDGEFISIWHCDEHPNNFAYIQQSPELPRSLYIGLHIIQTAPGTRIETKWIDSRSKEEFRAFPWIEAFPTSLEEIYQDANLQNLVTRCRWYDLDNEPEPIRSVDQLEGIIQNQFANDMVSELIRIGADVINQQWKPILVGLRYPSRSGGKEWLILKLMIKAEDKITKDVILRETKDGAILGAIRNSSLSVLRAQPLIRKNLEIRNGNQGTCTLQAKNVTLIGLGAIGSELGDILGKAGIGRLICVDHDILKSGNVIRHIGGLNLIGINKADVLRHVIHQHNPFVNVETIPKSVTSDLSELDSILGRSDLIVSATVDSNVDMVINEAAVRLGKTVIYGKALHAGSVARVVRVRPGEDACLKCLALYREAKEKGNCESDISEMVNQYVDIPEIEGEIVSRECGNPVLAGSAADLRFASDFTARAALDELVDSCKWNILTWSHQSLDKQIHPSLNQPYSTLLQTMKPHPRCPICSRPLTEGIIIAESQLDLIKKYTISKANNETGGILLGFLNGEKEIVITKITDSGPNAVETLTSFKWDDNYIQEQIDIASKEFGVKGLYVGEWHSHINPEPSPSSTDIESMFDITKSPNFATNEPVMLIAGYDKSSKTVLKIHASCFSIVKLGRYEEVNFVTEPDSKTIDYKPYE